MKEVYLYGAGGHAKVVAETLELSNITVKGVFDDNESLTSMLHLPVIGRYVSEKTVSESEIIITIGNNRIRKKVANEIPARFGTAIHPSAILSKTATIGYGTVVFAGVTVNSSSEIGKHAILNTQCSIDHECKIGDFTHISPLVALAGDVHVGEGTHVGIGACVIQGIRIGKWCTIGAGTVVISDVPDGATVVGNPGKIIKITEINTP